MSEEKCRHCDGRGKVDNNPDYSEQAPWSAWENLPPGSDIAVKLGIVKPQDCPDCGGTGEKK